MTHNHLPPTYALVRPEPTADPDTLERAVAKVGPCFPAIGAWLVEGWVSG